MTPAQYNEYQRQADVIDEAKRWEEERKSKESDEHIVDTTEMISSQTEISDEEIFKGIIEHCKIQHNRISSEINAMIEGAKWYRQQLKKL